MFRKNKSLSYGVIHCGEQGIVVIAHIEQADRFFVRARLRPGDGFKELVPCAVAARQGNIAIRKFMHARFASVHVGSHIHAG